jgi:hypothetical protein
MRDAKHRMLENPNGGGGGGNGESTHVHATRRYQDICVD